MQVKICGITQADQALAIAQMGATHLGFICVPQSPRYLPAERLADITQTLAAAGAGVGTVGVFANAALDDILAVAHQTRLTGLQLHGAEPVEFCQQLRQRLPGIRLIKAIRLKTSHDLALALTYPSYVDALLLDAYHPQQLGGTGLTLDWQTLGDFRPACPWLLAGGLRPDNVQEALSTLSPDGIDLSSGVERCPGQKDLSLVQQLFEQIRER